MLKTILWYLNFIWGIIIKTPLLYKVEKLDREGKQKEKEDLVNKVTCGWALSQLNMCGARVTAYGLENVPKDRAVLFVSNHQGNFDIPIIMTQIDKNKGFIAKVELQKIPLLRTWMKHMNCVFIERGNQRKAAEAILDGVKILKSGFSMILFPEGTRSKCSTLGEFKPASLKLATKSKVPIVPITIKDSFKLMEGNKNHITPADVEIHVHPMIETEKLTKEEENSLCQRLKDIIATKL